MNFEKGGVGSARCAGKFCEGRCGKDGIFRRASSQGEGERRNSGVIRDSGSGELIVRSGAGFRERRGWATEFRVSAGKIGERGGRGGELWRRAIVRRFVVTEEEMTGVDARS